MSFYGLASKRTRSTEPVTWTSRTPPGTWGAGDYIAAISGDATYWVIGCGGQARIATATDPTGTWTQVTSNPFGGDDIRALDYDGTNFCCVALGPKVYTAQNPTGTWVDEGNKFSSGNGYCIGWDGTYWSAGGSASEIRYATDPTGAWHAPTGESFTDDIRCMGYGNGHWVAGTNVNNQLGTATTNPTGTWTLRTSPFAGGSSILGCAYGNGYWVIVGSAGQLATATDPTGTWTLRTSSFAGGDEIYAVAYGNGAFACTGTGGKIATATNPTGTWTQRTNPESDFGFKIKYVNGYWIWGGHNATLCTAVSGL